MRKTCSRLAIVWGAVQLSGCAAPLWAARSEALLFAWHRYGQQIELWSDDVAKCKLEKKLYGRGDAPIVFGRTYIISLAVDDSEYFLSALAALSDIPLPAVKSLGQYSIRLSFHEPRFKAGTLFLSNDELRLYPVWRGVESQLEQLVQVDLLYGQFYRDIAEACARDDRWDDASRMYNDAVGRLDRWVEYRSIREGKHGINESEILLSRLSFLHNNRRYRESVAECREASAMMTHFVTVSGQEEITVTVPARMWGREAPATSTSVKDEPDRKKQSRKASQAKDQKESTAPE